MAAAVVLVVASGGAVAAASAVGDATIPGVAGTAAGIDDARTFTEVLLGILGHNLPAAASLASGILTAGASTVISAFLLGIFLGASISSAANTVGLASLMRDVGAYFPLEMAGLIAAALAGLLPLTSALASGGQVGDRFPSRYLRGLRPAAGYLGLAFALLLVGAAVEAAVIVGR